MYRYWKPDVKDHFYTTNANEIGKTVAGQVGKFGYHSEGSVGNCLKNKEKDSVPLYRYWQPQKSDHFYTTNDKEIGTTKHGQKGKYGYVSEGIACYVYPKKSRNELIPLYRYWNGAASDHFYTTNAAEIGTTQNGKVGKHGYSSEGITGWIFPTGKGSHKGSHKGNHKGNHKGGNNKKPPQGPKPGIYRIQATHSGKCLDIYGGSKAANTKAIQWPCHNGANQKWLLTYNAKNEATLTVQHSKQVLTITGNSKNNGALTIQYPNQNKQNQQFILKKQGQGYALQAVSSQKCVDVFGGFQTNAANVIQVIYNYFN